MATTTVKIESVDQPSEVKAHCPECDGSRSCHVHGATCQSWLYKDPQGNSANGEVNYSILRCKGCETVFYETSSWNSEDIDHWYDHMGQEQGEHPREKVTYPKPENKIKPVWFDAINKVDSQLHEILREMYIAHDNELSILTAVGLRTALDRATEVLDIDPAIAFNEKLDALVSGGWIGESEKLILGVVTDAGGAAAHRGWKPSSSEVSQLLSVIELFLQKAFIVGQKALEIKENIPARPARR
ncbi:MAG: DUF4145 domain-containing protein [Sphingorhabdus sp.]